MIKSLPCLERALLSGKYVKFIRIGTELVIKLFTPTKYLLPICEFSFAVGRIMQGLFTLDAAINMGARPNIILPANEFQLTILDLDSYWETVTIRAERQELFTSVYYNFVLQYTEDVSKYFESVGALTRYLTKRE